MSICTKYIVKKSSACVQTGRSPKKGEQVMWQQQWLRCCSELAQWDAVTEVGNATDNCALLIESLWRQSDYSNLRTNILPKALVRHRSCLSI